MLKASPGSVAAFRDLANVVYVSVGEKRRAGERTGRPALVAYVTRKEARPKSADRVPGKIMLRDKSGETLDLMTDVVELPSYPSVFGARAGSVLRAFDGDIGVCGFALPGGADGFIVTNAHVATNAANGQRGPLAVLDRSTNLFVTAGDVAAASFLRHGALVNVDVAAIQASGVVVEPGRIIDIAAPIASVIDIDGRQDFTYWYSVNGAVFFCAFPEFVGSKVPLAVDGGVVGYTQFWKFQMTRGAAVPGHSGALLCRTLQDGAIIACGLVFGGVAPSFVYAFPLKRSLASLGLG